MNTTIEQTTLYYRQGNADKVYQVRMEPKAEGFVVNVAYGRRGSTMTAGTKTPAPVPEGEARKVYERLIRDKAAKGYTPGQDGTTYRLTDLDGRDTGLRCQLPHAIDEERLPELVASTEFLMQEKFDGRRLMVRKIGAQIDGINRRGLIIPLPEAIVEAVRALPCDCILDGESLGDRYILFDLLQHWGKSLRDRPAAERLELLAQNLRGVATGAGLQLAESASSPAKKEAMLNRLRAASAEGVVFKRIDSLIAPGRETHSDWFKVKFVETASFVAGEPNDGRRSVALWLYGEHGALVPAGNVTIPASCSVPSPGAVVEVRYLYAHRQSGSIYQPVYLGERDDIDATECTVSQLKFKAGETAAVPANH